MKELFDDLGRLRGHAVSAKLGPGKAGAWLWYIEMEGIVTVNGLGDTPVPCRGVRFVPSLAGSDTGHSGHDYVYTQLMPPR